MAALKHTFVLRLFNTITPRRLVFRSQKSALHFGFVRHLAHETQKSSETGQGLQESEKKPEKPREQTEQSPTARGVKVREFLEKNGIRVKRIRGQINVSRLSLEKITKIFKFLDEIGIGREHKNKIILRRPSILTTKEDLLRNRVQTMENVGIYPDSVAYVIKEAPGVLTAKTEESLPEKVRPVRWHLV